MVWLKQLLTKCVDILIRSSNMSFENKINQLEKIVHALESNTTLDEGMQLYQNAIDLATECFSQLNSAKENIVRLKQQAQNLTE